VSLNSGKVSIRMNEERGLFYGSRRSVVGNTSIGGRNIVYEWRECSMDSGRISIRMNSGGVAFSGCLSLAVLGNISMDGGNVSWRRVWVFVCGCERSCL
jgi:hypothetical protein